MHNFYTPWFHGLSWANLTLIAITLIDIAWMLYWGVLTRRFDPPPLRFYKPDVVWTPLYDIPTTGDSQPWRESP